MMNGGLLLFQISIVASARDSLQFPLCSPPPQLDAGPGLTANQSTDIWISGQLTNQSARN